MKWRTWCMFGCGYEGGISEEKKRAWLKTQLSQCHQQTKLYHFVEDLGVDEIWLMLMMMKFFPLVLLLFLWVVALVFQYNSSCKLSSLSFSWQCYALCYVSFGSGKITRMLFCFTDKSKFSSVHLIESFCTVLTGMDKVVAE